MLAAVKGYFMFDPFAVSGFMHGNEVFLNYHPLLHTFGLNCKDTRRGGGVYLSRHIFMVIQFVWLSENCHFSLEEHGLKIHPHTGILLTACQLH